MENTDERVEVERDDFYSDASTDTENEEVEINISGKRYIDLLGSMSPH